MSSSFKRGFLERKSGKKKEVEVIGVLARVQKFREFSNREMFSLFLLVHVVLARTPTSIPFSSLFGSFLFLALFFFFSFLSRGHLTTNKRLRKFTERVGFKYSKTRRSDWLSKMAKNGWWTCVDVLCRTNPPQFFPRNSRACLHSGSWLWAVFAWRCLFMAFAYKLHVARFNSARGRFFCFSPVALQNCITLQYGSLYAFPTCQSYTHIYFFFTLWSTQSVDVLGRNLLVTN